MKNILIGVTGGIACYKSIEIVNQLKKDGYNVEVIMTRSAQDFVTPLTFRTMSGNQVITDMFDTVNKWDTKHIELAKKADLFVIVPATANVIGKIANGIADDMLTTVAMAVLFKTLSSPHSARSSLMASRFSVESIVIESETSEVAIKSIEVLWRSNTLNTLARKP